MALDYILTNTGPGVQERLDQVPVTQAQLTDEIANREAADAAETQAREAADTALQDSIGAEATRAEGAERTLGGRISAVEGKIPQGATPQNTLADKEWVTESITTATADFITASVSNLINYYLKSETYTKAEVQQIIDSIKQFNYQSVPVLPIASAATTGIIYLVPSADPQTGNVKDEYITTYQTNEMGVTYYSWEKIGSTTINLADYYTKSQTNAAITAIVEAALTSYYTKEECDERYVQTSPAPPIHLEETIFYGFAGNDLSGVTGLTEEDVELPDTLTRTVANSTAGYSFYIAVPATYSVQQVTQGGIEFPMGASETITIDGISYKRYKSSEESGYIISNYTLVITIA